MKKIKKKLCGFCKIPLNISSWFMPVTNKEYSFYECPKCGYRYSIKELLTNVLHRR